MDIHYWKILRVIESCTELKHLKVVYRMINNYTSHLLFSKRLWEDWFKLDHLRLLTKEKLDSLNKK